MIASHDLLPSAGAIWRHQGRCRFVRMGVLAPLNDTDV